MGNCFDKMFDNMLNAQPRKNGYAVLQDHEQENDTRRDIEMEIFYVAL